MQACCRPSVAIFDTTNRTLHADTTFRESWPLTPTHHARRALEPEPGRQGILRGMRLQPSLTFLCLFVLTGLSGCDLAGDSGQPAKPPLSEQAKATRDALPEHIFRGDLAGQPTVLLVHDCEVYRVEPRGQGDVHWESVLAPDPYPFWTSCDRQSIDFKAGELTVVLGRMAFGAGGCCATGGTYRSRDGRKWTKLR